MCRNEQRLSANAESLYFRGECMGPAPWFRCGSWGEVGRKTPYTAPSKTLTKTRSHLCFSWPLTKFVHSDLHIKQLPSISVTSDGSQGLKPRASLGPTASDARSRQVAAYSNGFTAIQDRGTKALYHFKELERTYKSNLYPKDKSRGFTA